MIKGVTHAHLGPIWYHSKPSDIPYSPNQFLGWDFFLPLFTTNRLTLDSLTAALVYLFGLNTACTYNFSIIQCNCNTKTMTVFQKIVNLIFGTVIIFAFLTNCYKRFLDSTKNENYPRIAILPYK